MNEVNNSSNANNPNVETGHDNNVGTLHATSLHNNNKNVPVLRFAEFADSGAWEERVFCNAFNFITTNSFSREKLNYQQGNVKNIHYGDIHTKFSTLFNVSKEKVPFINSDISLDKVSNENYCKNGDVIFADASEDMNDIGKSIEIIDNNNEKILSGLHTLHVRPKLNFSLGFCGYLFQSNDMRLRIQNEAQGAKVLGISKGRISSIDIFFPENEKEQQKIADCLASLDEQITSESEHLTALASHKKGLMQQLFPAHNKNIPARRFPEFKDSRGSDITLTELGTIISIFQGYAFSSKDATADGVKWLKIADVGVQFMNGSSPSFLPYDFKEKHSQFLVYKGDIVIALTRPLLGNSLKVAVVDKLFNESLLNQRVGKIKTKENINYIYYLLQNKWLIKEIENNIAGSEPPNFSMQQVKNIQLAIPNLPEQQKIADCLASLDELITAQRDKIDALQLHKKGLMQGLFPNVA